jgi:glycine cleavage system H protein
MENFGDRKNVYYYTRDHEWISFRGSVAYVGVCAFKLTGIKQIQQIEFEQINNFKKAGELLAIVHSGEYKIPIYMPVDGKIYVCNDELSGDNRNILIQQPEQAGWVAIIFPASPDEREGLLLHEQYLLNNKPVF